MANEDYKGEAVPKPGSDKAKLKEKPSRPGPVKVNP